MSSRISSKTEPEQSAVEKMDLLDFSNEILLQICQSLSDVDLMNVTRVCKRFKDIAEDTVAKKYNGDSDEKYYEITKYSGRGRKVHWCYREFLETFSGQIGALGVFMERRTNKHDLIKFMLEHCPSVRHVILASEEDPFPVSKMMQSFPNLCSLSLINLQCVNLTWMDQRFPQLDRLHLQNVSVDTEHLQRFLCFNPQLKHLHVVDCAGCSLYTLEEVGRNLRELKSLEFRPRVDDVIQEWRDINVPNLEYLNLSMGSKSMAQILGAIGRGSKMISSLQFILIIGNIDASTTLSEIGNVIGLFDKLTSLELCNFQMDIKLIESSVRKLPNLAKLELGEVQLEEISTHNILSVFESCKNLEELKLQNCSEFARTFIQFDLEFQRKLAKIARDHGKKIKFNLIQRYDNMLITDELIMKNGVVLYWTGYDASLSRSDVHLFDFNDELLEKICDYLDESAQRALYETCNKMKIAMQERIKSQWFTVSDEIIAKDLFSRFGEHITKVAIDMSTNNRQQMTETWTIINESGGKQITEISLKNVNVDATGSLPVQFPQLIVLRLVSMTSEKTHIFPLMQCTKLERLEFDQGDVIFPNQSTDLGISMNSLTTIRANYFSDSTYEILSRLDEKCCYQIKEFTVERNDVKMVKVVNTSMRFRNLVTLNLVCSRFEKTNIQYLFQSCTKLRKLTLLDVSGYEFGKWQQIIDYIKENCKQLEFNYGHLKDKGNFTITLAITS